MKIKITSPKYGEQTILLDEEDFHFIEDKTFYLWSSIRHYSYYVIIQMPKNKNLRLHRAVMNAKKDQIVDHINGNALDNRKQNLRVTNSTGNNQNARKRKGCQSKYKGVTLYIQDKGRKRWVAQIQVNKKKMSLGSFSTEKDAACAYDAAAKKHFKEYAVLNFPKERK